MFTTFRVFFFQFIFVLPARYVPMRNFLGNSEQTQAIYSMMLHSFQDNAGIR